MNTISEEWQTIFALFGFAALFIILSSLTIVLFSPIAFLLILPIWLIFLFLRFNRWKSLFFILFITLIGFNAFMASFLFDNYFPEYISSHFKDFFLLYTLFSVIWGLWLLLDSLFLAKGLRSRDKNPTFPENLDMEKVDHDAIVICHYFKRFRYPVYNGGIDILIDGYRDIPHFMVINGFRDLKRSYMVYNCKTTEDFDKVVTNPKVRNIWIFAHGAHGCVCLDDADCLDYSRYIGLEPKKKFVAQFHCNNFREEKDPSLAEIIAEDGFVTNRARFAPQDRSDIKQILRHLNTENWIKMIKYD